jgi:hypothetical protein
MKCADSPKYSLQSSLDLEIAINSNAIYLQQSQLEYDYTAIAAPRHCRPSLFNLIDDIHPTLLVLHTQIPTRRIHDPAKQFRFHPRMFHRHIQAKRI